LGVHLGGQYLDLDALSGGQIFNQAVTSAAEDLSVDPADIQPTHYSAENAFVYGGYGGVQLGWFRIGARLTHSFMEVTGEGGGAANATRFDLNLLTVLVEAQLRIPLWIFRPFFGIGLGYAFLDSDTTIVQGDRDATSDLGTNCLDAMAALGLDVNIGRWFSLGAVAHFSFIGFYYEDPANPEKTNAAWGFATDYMARATVRL
jgi:hypothetical protein